MTFWVAGAMVVGAGATAYSANRASNTQAQATRQASDTSLQASREAIAFQREQSAIAQAQQRPWLEAGQSALAQLTAGTRRAVPSVAVPVNAAGISQPVHAWLQQQQQASQQPVSSWNSPFARAPAAPEPWVQAGTEQAYGTGTPDGFLMEKSTAFSKPNTAFTTPNTAFTKATTAFTKPNTAFTKAFQFEEDPGYDFRLAEGMRGINNSAAARGGVLSGAALKAASKYNQNFASNEYGNAYNRYQTDETGKYNRYMQDNTAEYNRYQTDNTGEYNRYMQTNTDAYNRYQTDNTGQFNRDNQSQTNAFNRLASIAGVGQTAANQMSANTMQTGQQIGANLLATGNQVAQNQLSAGNAAAAGQVGVGNAITGAIGQGFNLYQGNQMMNMLANRGSGYNPVTAPVAGGYASEAARIQAQGY